MKTLILILSLIAAPVWADTEIKAGCEALAQFGKLELEWAKASYYTRKHVPSPSLLKMFSGISSENPDEVKAASLRIAALSRAIEKSPTAPYEFLADGAKPQVTRELWEFFRFRYKLANDARTYTPSSVSLFKDQEELSFALLHFDEIWSTQSNDLILYRDRPSGVATFNFYKDGTLYTVSVCVRRTASCQELGLVKTIHPICGPNVMELSLGRFKQVAKEISQRVAESNEQRYSLQDLGLRPQNCPGL